MTQNCVGSIVHSPLSVSTNTKHQEHTKYLILKLAHVNVGLVNIMCALFFMQIACDQLNIKPYFHVISLYTLYRSIKSQADIQRTCTSLHVCLCME